MNRRMKQILVLIAVAIPLTILPFAVSAQGELTLESLAEQIETVRRDVKNSVSLLTIAGKERAEAVSILSGKVSNLADRLTFLEGVLSPQVFADDGGYCRIALSDRIHTTTMTDYMNKYSEERLPDTIWITSVWVGPGGDVAVVYETFPHTRYATEYWSACEFVEHSYWTEPD